MGERKCYGKRRAEALLEGAAAGVRERAPNDNFRGSGSGMEGAGDGRRQGASAGSLLSSGGVTGGADRRHDDRCHDRRGTRKSNGMIATKRNGLERIRTSNLHSLGWVR